MNKNLCFYYWLKKIGKTWAFRIANTFERAVLVFEREHLGKGTAVANEFYMGQFNRRIFKDRRKRPTPGLSKFTVWGRRGTFRRKEDQRRGGYVDRYNSGLFFVLTMFVGLNILDAWFTMIILEDGGWEINPIVQSVITLYGDRFWVWKFCIVSFPLILLCLHNKFKWGMQCILGISFVYIIVILYQVFFIIY